MEADKTSENVLFATSIDHPHAKNQATKYCFICLSLCHWLNVRKRKLKFTCEANPTDHTPVWFANHIVFWGSNITARIWAKGTRLSLEKSSAAQLISAELQQHIFRRDGTTEKWRMHTTDVAWHRQIYARNERKEMQYYNHAMANLNRMKRRNRLSWMCEQELFTLLELIDNNDG